MRLHCKLVVIGATGFFYKRNQNYLTVKRSEMESEDEDCLQEVFKNGIVTKFYDFESIRAKTKMNLNELHDEDLQEVDDMLTSSSDEK